MTPQEDYLVRLMAFLAPRLESALKGSTATMDAWRVTVGTPSGSRRLRSYGACLFGADGASAEITLSRSLRSLTDEDDQPGVATVLLHEMCHAALGPDVSDRDGCFKRLCTAVGLVSNGSRSSRELDQELLAFARAHGPYSLDGLCAIVVAPRPQTTRLIKTECPNCGYTIRLTQRWIAVGMPICPCGTKMESKVK